MPHFKAYYILGESHKRKFLSKGVNENTNEITLETYKNVLGTKESKVAVDRGFRLMNNRLYSYSQSKPDYRTFTTNEKFATMEF